jgi:ABC-type glutathione transport system ATPase component
VSDARSSVYRLNSVDKVYKARRSSLFRPATHIQALQGISFEILEGESVGIVGESGSGKSTLSRILLAMDQPTRGDVQFRGRSLRAANKALRGQLIRDVQMVFQDPSASLDPKMPVGVAIAEPLRALRIEVDRSVRVKELLELVGLPADIVRRYPHEFSGGQRQRIAIARALAPGPRVLVADEPVSALDVSVQDQIIKLLNHLRQTLGLTLLMVAHDLAVVQLLCERTIVMHQGRIEEDGPTAAILTAPRSQYAQKLVHDATFFDLQSHQANR